MNGKFFVFLMVATAIFAGSINGQTDRSVPEPLEDTRVTLDARNVRFGEIIKELNDRYGVSVGVEESEDFEGKYDLRFLVNRSSVQLASRRTVIIGDSTIREMRFTIRADDRKLSEVLDRIADQIGNYRWSVNNGVVNFVPASKRIPEVSAYLDLKISKFRIINMTSLGGTMYELQSSVLQNEDSLNFFRERNLILSHQPVGYACGPLPEFSVPEGITVREILNILAKAKGGGWWISISRYGKKTAIALQI